MSRRERMRYPGLQIRRGDVVEHTHEDGEWTVEGWDDLWVKLVGPAPAKRRFNAVPALLRLVRRAPTIPRSPQKERARRVEPRERSVALNLGAHLGVARVDDEEDG